jgi:hypothetical protein
MKKGPRIVITTSGTHLQDSDRRPASNRRSIFKSMSDFCVTDIFTSYLRPFFIQILNSASNSPIFVIFQFLKSTSNSQFYGRFSLSQFTVSRFSSYFFVRNTTTKINRKISIIANIHRLHKY